jgi:dynein heavy chain
MYIFGKFDAFCKRTQKVVEMFSTIEKFTMIERLHIEGMETIIRRFSGVVSTLQRKPYDILDHRKNVNIIFAHFFWVYVKCSFLGI